MRNTTLIALILSVAIMAYGQEEYISSNGKKIVLDLDLPVSVFSIDTPISVIADQLALLSEKGLPNCSVSAWIEDTTLLMSITIDDLDFTETIYINGFISTVAPLQYMNCVYRYFLSMTNSSSSELMVMYDMYTIYNFQTPRGQIQFQGKVNYNYSLVISPFFITADGYEAKYNFNANRDIMIQLEMPYFRGSHRSSYLVYYVLKRDDMISDYPRLEGLSFLDY